MSDHHAQKAPATFGQFLLATVAALVPVLLVLFLLAMFIMKIQSPAGPATPEELAEAAAARIKPVGEVTIGAAPTEQAARSGEDVYKAVCSACHATGAVGSPKFGDSQAWAPRISQGLDTLFDHAKNGFNAMPAKGGDANLSDDELKAAIVYMANAGGAKFEAPKPVAAPAAEAPATEAPATEATPAPADASADTGKKVFEGTCVACHGAGVAGAPKAGDKAAWGPRIAQGMDTLDKHALEGFQGKSGVMPAKGGNPGLSDDDVKAAVAYMVGMAK